MAVNQTSIHKNQINPQKINEKNQQSRFLERHKLYPKRKLLNLPRINELEFPIYYGDINRIGNVNLKAHTQ